MTLKIKSSQIDATGMAAMSRDIVDAQYNWDELSINRVKRLDKLFRNDLNPFQS